MSGQGLHHYGDELQILLPPQGVVTRLSSDHLAVDDPEVAAAMRFITEHMKDGIGVEQLTRALNVSRRGLERRFRRVLGRTPGQEIRRMQIDRVKALLAGTDLSMPQTAASAGFSSAKQLSETFTRETGLAPTIYRRQFRH
jgi:LacI family transcriptional regulator